MLASSGGNFGEKQGSEKRLGGEREQWRREEVKREAFRQLRKYLQKPSLVSIK